MNRNLIINFLIKDIKLLNYRKVVLLSLFVIIYYYFYTNILLQRDEIGNAYFFGIGYISEDIMQTSVMGLISALFFLIGVTAIDLEEKVSIGYSIVASKIKIVNILFARIIFCIICWALTLLFMLLYFSAVGYNIKFIFLVVSNSILFTYSSYIGLVFLLSQRRVEMILSFIIVIYTLYIPIFISLYTMFIINVGYFLTVTAFSMFFVENNYRNKLKDEMTSYSVSDAYKVFMEYIIDHYVNLVSDKIYSIINKVIPSNLERYLSYIYFDIHRYLIFIRSLLILLILLIIFRERDILLNVLMFIFYGRLVIEQTKIFKSDIWTCKIGIVDIRKYTIYKMIISFSFNYIFIILINVIVNYNNYIILVSSLFMAILMSFVNILLCFRFKLKNCL